MKNIGTSKFVKKEDICVKTNLDYKLVLKDVRHMCQIFALIGFQLKSWMRMDTLVTLVMENGSSPLRYGKKCCTLHKKIHLHIHDISNYAI